MYTYDCVVRKVEVLQQQWKSAASARAYIVWHSECTQCVKWVTLFPVFNSVRHNEVLMGDWRNRFTPRTHPSWGKSPHVPTDREVWRTPKSIRRFGEEKGLVLLGIESACSPFDEVAADRAVSVWQLFRLHKICITGNGTGFSSGHPSQWAGVGPWITFHIEAQKRDSELSIRNIRPGFSRRFRYHSLYGIPYSSYSQACRYILQHFYCRLFVEDYLPRHVYNHQNLREEVVKMLPLALDVCTHTVPYFEVF
jgi:hypothetical protein